MSPAPLVVVGAGLTGAAAVQTLRGEGHEGPIVLVGAEAHPPYERPPLSKEYLRGEQDRDRLSVHPATWYEENGIETRFGVRATALDVAERSVELEGGERLGYERLLLATGGRPRRIVEPGDRILELRTIEDAERLRGVIEHGGRLLVVGAGFIGAEVAASARQRGMEVTVLERGEVPLEHALGTEMGRIYASIHRDHGVDLRLGVGAEKIEETADAAVLTTSEGERIEGDAVVVGVGIVPNTELAEAAGLPVDGGILVDPRCRTAAEDVFAAGDVAKHDHPLFGRRLRVEHYDNALKMGAAAARCMLGRHEAFDDPHWFWSDQYEVNLQYAGFAHEWDEIVTRGSIEDLDFTAFYLHRGLLLAALAMNRPRDARRAGKLIAARTSPDPGDLRDDDVDLRRLVPSA